MRFARLPYLLILFSASGFAVAPATAKTIHLSAPTSCEATGTFEKTANSLQPGDELVLGPGLFCQTGRRLIQVSGTAAKPIVIRSAGAAKTIVTRPGDLSATGLIIQNDPHELIDAQSFSGAGVPK